MRHIRSIECLHSRPSALGDPGHWLEDWGECSTSVVAVPDSVSHPQHTQQKRSYVLYYHKWGRVVFLGKRICGTRSYPPEELNGLYETEKSVVWLALCIGSFQSDGCRVLSTSLVRANSLGRVCMGVWMQGTCIASEALLFFSQIFFKSSLFARTALRA